MTSTNISCSSCQLTDLKLEVTTYGPGYTCRHCGYRMHDDESQLMLAEATARALEDISMVLRLHWEVDL